MLARGRTELAFIRTGLALIAIGFTMMRFFGLGLWTILDGSLVLMGTFCAIFGITRFLSTLRSQRQFEGRLHALLTSGASALMNSE